LFLEYNFSKVQRYHRLFLSQKSSTQYQHLPLLSLHPILAMSRRCFLFQAVLLVVIVVLGITTRTNASSSAEMSKQKEQDHNEHRLLKHHDGHDDPLFLLSDAFQQAHPSPNNNNHHRKLPYQPAIYKCNKVIATFSPDEVSTILDTFFLNIVGPIQAPFFRSKFFPLLQYGVQVKTVCASCKSTKKNLSKKEKSNADYKKYCGKKVYGYKSKQSGLVMIPLVVAGQDGDNDNSLVELSGTLAAFIHTRGTVISRFDVPSQSWSTEEDGHQDVELLMCFLATATRGRVSIAPDFMGYGYDFKSARGYLVRDSYITSMLPLWMKVKSDLSIATDCQTALGGAAFVRGYSEGGELISFSSTFFKLLQNLRSFLLFLLLLLCLTLCLTTFDFCHSVLQDMDQ
jgi:hypothetical protein